MKLPFYVLLIFYKGLFVARPDLGTRFLDHLIDGLKVDSAFSLSPEELKSLLESYGFSFTSLPRRRRKK